MNVLISHIDELAILHDILPGLVKVSLVVLICLAAYVPVSLISWIISVAFQKPLTSLVVVLGDLSDKFFNLSKRCNARSKRFMDNFYEKYSTQISFDNPKYHLSGHPVQQSIDNFESELKLAPSIATDREAHKTELVARLNSTLQNLGGGVDKLNDIKIPELDLDKNHETRKRAALSSLLLFIPLLIAVVLVNTALLNEIFASLIETEIEILGFDLPLPPFIAVMFTLIELGVGVVFGFQERKKQNTSSNVNDLIIHAFGWFIIVGLALMEFVFYLMIGTGVEDFEELMEMLDEGFISAMLAGGILSVLGPCIVLALYIFGHRVSIAFFDYSAETDLVRFKRDLDSRFDTFQKIQIGMEEHSVNIKGIIEQIRKENVELSKDKKVASSTALSKFKDALDQKLKAINDAVKNAEAIEIPPPKIEAQQLSREDTTNFHRTNLVYFLILLSSLLVMAIALPTEISFGYLSLSGNIERALVAILFVSLAVFAGLSLMTKVLISQTTDGVVGRAILEKPTALNTAISIVILFLCLLLMYLIFSAISLVDNLVPLIFCLLSLVGGFVVGRRLVQAVSSWYAMFKSFWLNLISICYGFLGVLSVFVEKIVALLHPIFEALSFPIRFIFRKV